LGNLYFSAVVGNNARKFVTKGNFWKAGIPTAVNDLRKQGSTGNRQSGNTCRVVKRRPASRYLSKFSTISVLDKWHKIFVY
jgi:hypothetical protein